MGLPKPSRYPLERNSNYLPLQLYGRCPSEFTTRLETARLQSSGQSNLMCDGRFSFRRRCYPEPAAGGYAIAPHPVLRGKDSEAIAIKWADTPGADLLCIF
ncbi:hypothetical protein [Nostoc sp.]